jgi:hypothetical protein
LGAVDDGWWTGGLTLGGGGAVPVGAGGPVPWRRRLGGRGLASVEVGTTLLAERERAADSVSRRSGFGIGYDVTTHEALRLGATTKSIRACTTQRQGPSLSVSSLS